jgi:hypothetical protein
MMPNGVKKKISEFDNQNHLILVRVDSGQNPGQGNV